MDIFDFVGEYITTWSVVICTIISSLFTLCVFLRAASLGLNPPSPFGYVGFCKFRKFVKEKSNIYEYRKLKSWIIVHEIMGLIVIIQIVILFLK